MENYSNCVPGANSTICGERFQRDKERIKALEEKGDAAAALLSQTVTTLERVNLQLDDHELRLRQVEKRPSAWFDRGSAAFVSAIISAFVAWLVKGGAI